MTDKVIENNQVVIMGEVVSDFTFSHEIFGEGFYMVDVEVARLSDSSDIIPVMVSERLIDVTADYKGCFLSVTGQFRSYNRHEEKKNKLVLSVFARELAFVEESWESSKTNQIYLDGYICKDPIYRNASALCILQIGELVGKLTDEFRVQHPGVPWRQIKAMRNIVAHSYGSVDSETTWEIITEDIPKLKQYCLGIIQDQ